MRELTGFVTPAKKDRWIFNYVGGIWWHTDRLKIENLHCIKNDSVGMTWWSWKFISLHLDASLFCRDLTCAESIENGIQLLQFKIICYKTRDRPWQNFYEFYLLWNRRIPCLFFAAFSLVLMQLPIIVSVVSGLRIKLIVIVTTRFHVSV